MVSTLFAMESLFKHLSLCSLSIFTMGSFPCFCVPDVCSQAFMGIQYVILYKLSLISLHFLASAYFLLQIHKHTTKSMNDLY